MKKLSKNGREKISPPAKTKPFFHLGCSDEIICDRFAEIIARESSIKKLMSLYGYHNTKIRNVVNERLIKAIHEGGKKSLIEFLVESHRVNVVADE